MVVLWGGTGVQYSAHKPGVHIRNASNIQTLSIIAGKKRPQLRGLSLLWVVLTVSVSIGFYAEPHSTPRHNHAISDNIIVSGAPELQIGLRFGISSPSSAVNL